MLEPERKRETIWRTKRRSTKKKERERERELREEKNGYIRDTDTENSKHQCHSKNRSKVSATSNER